MIGGFVWTVGDAMYAVLLALMLLCGVAAGVSRLLRGKGK
jgi:hypothetical protein